MHLRYACLAFFAISSSFGTSPATAQPVEVVGGRTSVALNFDALSSLAGLDLSGVSPEVIVPGDVPDSVAFGINPRDAAVLPTTFSYDPTDFLGTFMGSIEHTGSVFFNADTVEVGDFTIAFDVGRVGTLPSGDGTGFYVESNAGLTAILFDVVNIDGAGLVASDTALQIPAQLAVSPEFGQILLDGGFSATNLEGAVVGDAFVAAVVPEPATATLLLISVLGMASLGRRR